MARQAKKLTPLGSARYLGLNILGMTINAIGIACFTSPNQVVPGGFTAIATMINAVTGVPTGVLIILINLPTLFWAWRVMERRFVIKTTFGVIASAMILDLVIYLVGQSNLTYQNGEPILAALFGGVLMGVGVSICGLSGTSPGGTTTLGILLHRKNPQFQVGKLGMFVNIIIVLISMVVYREMEAAMYGIICIFTFSSTMDAISYGLNANFMVIVISQKSEEIRLAMYEEIKRGSTILAGEGAHKHKSLEVILTVISKSEYYALHQIVKEVDPDAYMISTESGEVLGKGFHRRGF